MSTVTGERTYVSQNRERQTWPQLSYELKEQEYTVYTVLCGVRGPGREVGAEEGALTCGCMTVQKLARFLR